jgi:outer membrane protein
MMKPVGKPDAGKLHVRFVGRGGGPNERGIGTAIEVAQARQATAQARLVMIQATGAAQNAYLTLISAMGISPLTQIKVAGVADRRLSPELAGSAERVISAALARRPDILAAYAA